MYEWSPEHQAIAAAVRRFVDEDLKPAGAPAPAPRNN